MTVKELYECCKEQGIENFEIEIKNRDEYPCVKDPETFEPKEPIIINLVDKKVIL